MAVGTYRGAARDLPAAAVPRREATLKEVAPLGVVLWDADRVGEPHGGARPRTVGEPRRGAQPVRARGTALAGGCGASPSPATAPVHPGLGGQPGGALPPFWG